MTTIKPLKTENAYLPLQRIKQAEVKDHAGYKPFMEKLIDVEVFKFESQTQPVVVYFTHKPQQRGLILYTTSLNEAIESFAKVGIYDEHPVFKENEKYPNVFVDNDDMNW